MVTVRMMMMERKVLMVMMTINMIVILSSVDKFRDHITFLTQP